MKSTKYNSKSESGKLTDFKWSEEIAKTKNASNGLKKVWLSEKHFKMEVIITVLAMLFFYVVGVPGNDLMWILLACFLMMITEVVNTAIEEIMDFIHPDFHPQVGKIKDAAAGAVFLAVIFGSLTGIIIFIKNFSLITVLFNNL